MIINDLDLLFLQKDLFVQDEPFSVVWYRGHSKTWYPLVPGLFRLRLGNDLHSYIDWEKNALEKFIRLSEAKNIDIGDHSWSTLSVMQHYGVKTRLLDWTPDFDIALFFAFEGWTPKALKEEDRRCAMFFLSPALLNKVGGLQSVIVSNPKRGDTYSYRKFLDKKPDSRGALAIEIEHAPENERVKAQQGVFTVHDYPFPLETELSFKEAYGYGKSGIRLPSSSVLKKVELIPDLYHDVEKYLVSKGITPSSVYPDLHGISIEVNRTSAAEHKKWWDL